MRIRTHANPLNYTDRMSALNLDDLRPSKDTPIDLEIGFGRGVFIRNYAKENPGRCIIGIDVRKQIKINLDEKLEKEKIPNVHLLHGNGSVFLNDACPDNCLHRVFIFHPDPWLKKRHIKRRLINTSFLTQLHPKLISNARIFICTDVALLADDIQSQFNRCSDYLSEDAKTHWPKDYETHWSEFSSKDDRTLFNFIYKKNV